MFEGSRSEGGELLALLGSEPFLPSLRLFLSLDIKKSEGDGMKNNGLEKKGDSKEILKGRKR